MVSGRVSNRRSSAAERDCGHDEFAIQLLDSLKRLNEFGVVLSNARQWLNLSRGILL